MNEAFENLRAYATDERNTEAFKRNARDMGVAFADAWGEVSRGFERAFSRLRSGRQAEQIEEQKVEEENRK